MQNKTILSVSMWLLVVFLGIFYFITENKQNEKDAITVEKSKYFLENQIPYRQNEILEEQYTRMEETGLNAKDLAIYNPIKQNLVFSDSLYQTNNYEWKYLKNHLIKDFYNNAQIKEDDILLNYTSKNPLVNQLHKLSLYTMYSRYHLMGFNTIGCGFGIHFSKYQLMHLSDREHIGLFYNYENDLSSSTIYQDNKPVEKLNFDVQKDTTIYFKIHTDYYKSNIDSTTKNYKLEIKAGQQNNFEIVEIR